MIAWQVLILVGECYNQSWSTPITLICQNLAVHNPKLHCILTVSRRGSIGWRNNALNQAAIVDVPAACKITNVEMPGTADSKGHHSLELRTKCTKWGVISCDVGTFSRDNETYTCVPAVEMHIQAFRAKPPACICSCTYTTLMNSLHWARNTVAGASTRCC